MCTHYNRLDEAILMSTHNIQFHNKIRKFPSIYVLELSKKFRKDSKISSNKPLKFDCIWKAYFAKIIVYLSK